VPAGIVPAGIVFAGIVFAGIVFAGAWRAIVGCPIGRRCSDFSDRRGAVKAVFGRVYRRDGVSTPELR